MTSRTTPRSRAVDRISRSVVRGEYVFDAALIGGADSVIEHITVSKRGRQVDAGRLELYSPDYLASRRYALAYNRSPSKPVGRVGQLLIGPDAANALTQALRDMHDEWSGAVP